jgi:hypothetical protein
MLGGETRRYKSIQQSTFADESIISFSNYTTISLSAFNQS